MRAGYAPRVHRARRRRPHDRPRSLGLAILLVAAACGGPGGERSTTDGAASTGSPATSSPTERDPAASASPGSDLPPASETPASETPASSEPAPSRTADPGGGTATETCSGSPENRDFYLAVAEAVDWTVLCPVLPDGWFVESGTYRLAGGGWLEIAYRGPAGARIRLREGGFCPDASGCVPSGVEVEDVAVGPLVGRLIATDDGGWAVVVDRGAQRSWLFEGSGIDEATFRSLAGALVEVDA